MIWSIILAVSLMISRPAGSSATIVYSTVRPVSQTCSFGSCCTWVSRGGYAGPFCGSGSIVGKSYRICGRPTRHGFIIWKSY